jgi:pilus assembly protein Flp/PilA
MLLTFLADERAATAIEYGLIAALIAVAIIGAMMTVGSSLQSVFNFTSNKATTVWNNSLS